MAKLNKEELERDEVVKVLAKIELDALLSSRVVDEPEGDEPEEEETDKKAEIELPQRKAAKNSK